MTKERFTEVFGHVVQDVPWAVERAFEQRPFADTKALREAFQDAVLTGSSEQQLELHQRVPRPGRRGRDRPRAGRRPRRAVATSPRTTTTTSSSWPARTANTSASRWSSAPARPSTSTGCSRTAGRGWTTRLAAEKAFALIEIAKIANYRFDDLVADANPDCRRTVQPAQRIAVDADPGRTRLGRVQPADRAAADEPAVRRLLVADLGATGARGRHRFATSTRCSTAPTGCSPNCPTASSTPRSTATRGSARKVDNASSAREQARRRRRGATTSGRTGRQEPRVRRQVRLRLPGVRQRPVRRGTAGDPHRAAGQRSRDRASRDAQRAGQDQPAAAGTAAERAGRPLASEVDGTSEAG